MSSVKVAVTIDGALLAELDRWVAAGDFPNRSQAVQAAIRRLQEERRRRQRLLAELAKLDPQEERALAEEMLSAGYPLTWQLPDGVMPCASWIKVSQARTLSTERLGERISAIDERALAEIVAALNELIG